MTDIPTAEHSDRTNEGPGLFVGLGASAGGITALRDFMAHVPRDAGIAYMVILHLSPDHESKLAEVLQAVTTIPVTQVSGDVTAIQADHIYVVPPNKLMAVTGGNLTLSDITRREQRRAPIDFFFRTLADAHGDRAVCVVLSGTGSDGAGGLKRVKELGGLTLVQDPATAEYADMPAAAAASGLADVIATPAEMPAKIVEFLQHVDGDVLDSAAPLTETESLREVLTILRVRTGHDFANYKTGTVLRRIARRMNVRQIGSMADYARYMRGRSDEPTSLMRDLLISVTNFFRDRDAFAVLEQRIIPRLFTGRQSSEQIRAWSAGCATGEEAYSLAMLLTEHAAAQTDPPALQVFATDLDEQAIAVAREGLYTEAEVADVSDERLQRFFTRVANGFRVRRELRETVLFARHNVLKDPPFSHLDLVVCRNVLIYLNRAVQEQLLETFHFALRPGRYLFLGTSEGPEASGHLFYTADKSAHIYESRAAASRPSLLALADISLGRAPRLPSPVSELGSGERLPADVHLRLLEQYAPPSILVGEDQRVIHISPGAAGYLRVGPGEPSRDLLQMVHPDLRANLRAALQEALRDRASVDVRVRLADGNGDRSVRVMVRPVVKDGEPGRGYVLVLFDEEAAGPAAPHIRELPTPVDAEARHLDAELADVRHQLRGTVEQYETQVEEVKASNEELQALNEELRSSAEELETSKEELESVNEELTTVNQELKIKIEELGLTNNDIQNFINSSDIASVFLDGSLRVKLATPRVRQIFNLLPSDAGRQLSDITHRLHYDHLHADVRQVLETLATAEREVQAADGRWYVMRILPYRTTDDRIDGVVIIFLDVTARREVEHRLRAGEERLRLLIESAVDYAIFSLDATGRIDYWNAGAQRMFHYAAEEILGQPFDLLFTPEDRAAGAPEQELRKAESVGRAEDERWHLRKNGERIYCSGVTTKLGGTRGLGFCKIARDLTAQRRSEEALRAAHADLEHRVDERTSQLQERVRRHAESEEAVTALLRKVVTAQEDERGRIARDLHDQLGQQLTALRLILERAAEHGEPATADLGRALEITAALDREIDFLAWELRPAVLDDLGLGAALPRVVEAWGEHYGIETACRSGNYLAGQLSREGEVTFYRILQEALNNVVKHAGASRVDVLLEVSGGTVTLVVEDNGLGFDPTDPASTTERMGLVGMRERAALIGASLQIESKPGAGTAVYLRSPAATPVAETP